MGFLLDLIHRLLGPRARKASNTRPPAKGAPSRPAPPRPDAEPPGLPASGPAPGASGAPDPPLLPGFAPEAVPASDLPVGPAPEPGLADLEALAPPRPALPPIEPEADLGTESGPTPEPAPLALEADPASGPALLADSSVPTVGSSADESPPIDPGPEPEPEPATDPIPAPLDEGPDADEPGPIPPGEPGSAGPAPPEPGPPHEGGPPSSGFDLAEDFAPGEVEPTPASLGVGDGSARLDDDSAELVAPLATSPAADDLHPGWDPDTVVPVEDGPAPLADLMAPEPAEPPAEAELPGVVGLEPPPPAPAPSDPADVPPEEEPEVAPPPAESAAEVGSGSEAEREVEPRATPGEIAPDAGSEEPAAVDGGAGAARPDALRPMGLAADLAAPIPGHRGRGEAAPTLADRLADLGRDPQAPLDSPEAAALRAATDEALVAEGYLTAQALRSAHAALGASPRPGLDPNARAARRAAAEESRRRRAEAIAEAQRTEVPFLGRGVSEALHDHRGDPAKLAQLGLPALGRPADLAERLGITVGRLRWLAFHAEVATRVHYVAFEVPKAGGGTRRLSAPHRSLDQAQRWILGEIVGRLPVEPEAHGFVTGRSILTNARPHARRAVVVNLDLEGFFPSIGHRAVRSVFERAGYSPALATVLALLCTEAPRRAVAFEGVVHHVATGPRGLPQGACTSPGLANQVARRLDRRLRGLADHFGATYTRYADDLTFSGGPDLDRRVGALMAATRRIAASEGFRIHEGKTRVQRPNAAQIVTGLVVNDRPGVPRVEARRLRAILHRARLEGLDAQNRAGHPDFRASLVGRIAFVGMARPDLGARLLAEYRALDHPPNG